MHAYNGSYKSFEKRNRVVDVNTKNLFLNYNLSFSVKLSKACYKNILPFCTFYSYVFISIVLFFEKLDGFQYFGCALNVA